MPGRADGAVAVVIPAYQAAATLGAVVTGARQVLPDATIYVVDDGSGDETGAGGRGKGATVLEMEEHTSELQSQSNLVCRLLLEKKTRHHHVIVATVVIEFDMFVDAD